MLGNMLFTFFFSEIMHNFLHDLVYNFLGMCGICNSYKGVDFAESIDFLFLATEAPRILKEIHDLDIIEGQEAVFACEITGMPRPEVTW